MTAGLDRRPDPEPPGAITAALAGDVDAVAGPHLRHRRWVVVAVLAGVAILVFVVTRADLRDLARTAHEIDPVLLLLPALATVGSYLTMARSYEGIAAAAGWRVRFFDMLRITVVANTANYLLATGGLSGFALRMYLFTRRGIPAGSAVLISLVQTVLTNLILLMFVIGGFMLLFLSHSLMGRDLAVAGTMLVAFTALVLLTLTVIVHARWRRRVVVSATKLIQRSLRRFAPHRKTERRRLLQMQRKLHAGLDFLLARPRAMLAPTVYIVLDWVFTLLVLYTAFVAIGHPIGVSYVIAGFSIGIFFSMVSLVPAGIGVLEGSMTAVFASLDVPLEHAVVATLIFRVAYYGLPALASLVFARATVRSVR